MFAQLKRGWAHNLCGISTAENTLSDYQNCTLLRDKVNVATMCLWRRRDAN